MTAGEQATLSRLRTQVAQIEGQDVAFGPGAGALPLGVTPVDTALKGGLAGASLHEIAPGSVSDIGTATGFALLLAAHTRTPGKQALWIQTDYGALEAGSIYGCGLASLGLPARELVVVNVKRPLDALWTMEEALKCNALSCVVGELPRDGALADLTATRRLTLAARAGGGFGLLLRQRVSPLTSSAETRWQVAATPSLPDRYGGLGRTAFDLSLVKNRRGPTGRWLIAWDRHERAFAALSLAVAPAAADRQDRAPSVRAG